MKKVFIQEKQKLSENDSIVTKFANCYFLDLK